MQQYAEKFYKSKAWQHCRQSYARSVGGLCEQCRAKGLIVPGVIVHHKIHLTPENVRNPDITLDWGNMELLCRDCHAAAHKQQKRYLLDDLGRIRTYIGE